jgi:hypothetical protein
MFVRLVYESFRRQKRRKLLAGAAITLGVTVATAMIAVATDIGDKINRELRTIGANLIITPQEDTLDVEIGGVNLKPPSDGAFLNEADLPKIKSTFWHNNITRPCWERILQSKCPSVETASPRACGRRIPGGECQAAGRMTIPETC